MQEEEKQSPTWVNRHAWKILAAMGILLTIWGIHQMVFIPRFDPEHWAWLTMEPEIIDYFKFWFRNHGVWTTANGAFFTFVAAASFKKRARWAWWVLAYLPVHIILLTTQFYWLFFITIPLTLLAVWALWATREDLQPEASHGRNFGWVFFIVIGLVVLYFAYDNFFVIPALDVHDPDRGWAWLTADPEIIDYIKLYFRVFGIRVLALGTLTMMTAAIGLRRGDRMAWAVLGIVPLLTGAHFYIMPWTAPFLAGLILLAGLGLWLSYPKARERAKYES